MTFPTFGSIQVYWELGLLHPWANYQPIAPGELG